MNYDVIVIGGGPGGYSAALKAAKNGLRTLLIEKDKLGGVCLNEGCIPTKTLLYSAKIFDSIKSGSKYGVTAEGLVFDHAKVLKRKDKTVKILTAGIRASLEKAGVVCLAANATLTPDGVLADGARFTAEHIILAAGSSAMLPNISGALNALTSREVLSLAEVPQSLAVVGGGVVGLELASYFNSIGTQVTVVEMLGKIGGSLDAELAEILMKNYQKKGMTFVLNARVTEIRQGSLVYEQAGESAEILCDKVLMSVGRTPNVADLGLAETGIRFSGKGIETNEFCQTNVQGIYAIGDVNGKSMLAHTAYREADACVNHILGIKDRVDYGLIPSVIYTNPEAAWVGAPEDSPHAGETVKIPMRYSGRYLAENEGGDGLCKIVLGADKQILGVHLLGGCASEIIYGAGMLIANQTKAEDIEKIVFPHPTVSEILREALL
ncbi:MAG: dihydrolipoyl dehydrogenase [Clostridiales bacterium]|nr:dihydrolipoyl dehydrogenase [Clostridiales bacterium]